MTLTILSAYGFSTPGMDDVFSPHSVVNQMLSFEAALALALADAGMAPRAEAEAVAAACAEPMPNPEAILGTTWEQGTPVIALIDAIKERLDHDDERRWVHYGATTQDVIDTAHMLLAKQGLELLEGWLIGSAGRMRALVDEHRDQPQIGRAFLQHAAPTTFGLRVASWLNPLLTGIVAIRDMHARLPTQLGGPVGNLAAYGENGTDVVAALADRLKLQVPTIAWHGDRSIVWQLAGTVDSAVASASKVALDVGLLAQSDISEISVRAGGSSSMPGKRNPIDVIHALAAAGVCHGAAGMITGSGPHELDRALGAWHVEWAAIPLLFASASAVLEATETLLATLQVDADAMSGSADVAVDATPPRPESRQIEAVLDRFRVVLGR